MTTRPKTQAAETPALEKTLVTIKNTGDEDYNGNDLTSAEKPRFVHVLAGGTAEVTADKAKQLLDDFGDQFEIV